MWLEQNEKAENCIGSREVGGVRSFGPHRSLKNIEFCSRCILKLSRSSKQKMNVIRFDLKTWSLKLLFGEWLSWRKNRHKEIIWEAIAATRKAMMVGGHRAGDKRMEIQEIFYRWKWPELDEIEYNDEGEGETEDDSRCLVLTTGAKEWSHWGKQLHRTGRSARCFVTT